MRRPTKTQPRRVEGPQSCRQRFSLLRAMFLAFVCLGLVAGLRADAILGRVTDPSGAVVPGAQITIIGGDLANPVALTSDGEGKFEVPELKPGKYAVQVSAKGFDTETETVELDGTAQLQIHLILATHHESVTTTAKVSGFANSDPVYRQLRDIGMGETVVTEEFTLNVDVGTFEFKSGTITFLAPVNGAVTGAVFVGRGHFTLKPVGYIDSDELMRRTGAGIFEEDFTEAVFRFTPNIAAHFPQPNGHVAATPAQAAAAFEHWKDEVRRRNDFPLGFTQELLAGEAMDNVDADVLAALYNPKHPMFINAYMHGTKHKDLRYFVRVRVGALPQLDSPEEVALLNCAGGDLDDGVWYSSHLKEELLARTANSLEDKRLFATRRYKLETVLSKNNHLFSSATITFEPLWPGERVMKFDLLPNLRVSRVTDETGQELHYIQEGRKEDGSFYLVLDKAPETGVEHSITVEYAGDKVLDDAGNGSYYVRARESWYPNLNGFGEKALYDLTFKVPHNNKVISVGNLEGESTEEGLAVTHWVTPVPIAVAGFNYGAYKKVDIPDTITHYKISGYYLTDLPDSLEPYRQSAFLASMAPSKMTEYALEQARAQMQLCTYYFGQGPYDTLSITEQPNFAFGQSWPNLVYLPISAYIDSTQRWLLFGRIDNNFTGFVREVTPHEVSHQWWGHEVGWASYHDQWLSEGFAEFSAGLFLQQAMGGNWRKDYIDFWERARKRILDKNSFGVAPNDAGPLWLGLRLISPRSPEAYQALTYSKGAFVLQMLRSIMWNDHADPNDREKDFIAMMHDFVDAHRDTPASTESFKAIAEKHMTKQMDLQGNRRLDWFFNEWVYGTQVPHYDFHYEIEATQGGVRVHAHIAQSDVDQYFAMFVPVFADFGNGMVRLGQVLLVGNSTRAIDFVLPQQPKKVELNAYKDILER